MCRFWPACAVLFQTVCRFCCVYGQFVCFDQPVLCVVFQDNVIVLTNLCSVLCLRQCVFLTSLCSVLCFRQCVGFDVFQDSLCVLTSLCSVLRFRRRPCKGRRPTANNRESRQRKNACAVSRRGRSKSQHTGYTLSSVSRAAHVDHHQHNAWIGRRGHVWQVRQTDVVMCDSERHKNPMTFFGFCSLYLRQQHLYGCREGEKIMADEWVHLLIGALCGCREGQKNVADEWVC